MHDIATVFLIFGSAVSNQIGLGAAMCWINFMGTIANKTFAFFRCMHYNEATRKSIIVLIGVWFYFKLFSFAFLILGLYSSDVSD